MGVTWQEEQLSLPENPQTTAKKKYRGDCKPITAAKGISAGAVFKTDIWGPDTDKQNCPNIFICSWASITARIAQYANIALKSMMEEIE